MTVEGAGEVAGAAAAERGACGEAARGRGPDSRTEPRPFRTCDGGMSAAPHRLAVDGSDPLLCFFLQPGMIVGRGVCGNRREHHMRTCMIVLAALAASVGAASAVAAESLTP